MIQTDFKYELDKVPSVTALNKSQNAVNELNGFFISHFFKLIYNSVDVINAGDSGFNNSSGEKIFREFLLNEYGDIMSSKFQLTNDMISHYVSNINESNTTLNVET